MSTREDLQDRASPHEGLPAEDLAHASEAKTRENPGSFTYQDRTFEPAEPLTVETSPDVFYPTSTTRLLLRAVRREVRGPVRSALDLGCGCGIVAIALRRFVAPESQVCASDVSPAAVALTRRNSDRLGADVEVRCGSLFEPWQGRRFDLIVDDVSALAESIARSSPWYPPPVPSEAGEDGTRWIRSVLEQAPGFLSEGGRLIFPVLTLAHQERTLEAAAASFRTLRPLAEEWYPLGPELAARPDLLEALAERGIVEIRSRGSRRLWATRVYLAADPRA